MLVWINGPFGGGKTQTAYEINRRLPGSFISDPEEAGFGLHRMLPRGQRGDFQDQPVWRQAVHDMLDRLLREYPGTVIAPMTVVEPVYFAEIVGRLRAEGHQVAHFALLARRETVVRRLRERVVGRTANRLVGNWVARRESFAMGKIDLCLDRLRAPEFAEHIHTDELTVPQVAEHIAASAGLTLRPNTDGPLRGRLRRAQVGVAHIRLG